MATPSVAVNPKVRYVPSGALALMKVKAAASQTWKKGEFGIFSSNQVLPCVSGDIPQCIFAETQSTSTSADDPVWVYMLEVGTELEMSVSNAGTAAAETTVDVGTAYDLSVASNKHYINNQGTTDACFLILKRGSDMEPAQNTTTMVPGIVLVRLTKVI